MKYTDLVIRCDTCDGSGYVYNSRWSGVNFDNWSTAEIRQFIHEHGNEELECGECNGAGKRYTEMGEALRRLIYPMIWREVRNAISKHKRLDHGLDG